ncbi:MAG TPA: serine/threonine-protein kinase [Polyangiaceae bacterium]|jgi:serine/threonine-protein kinase
MNPRQPDSQPVGIGLAAILERDLQSVADVEAALLALRRARGTPYERAAIDLVAQANALGRAPGPLLAAAADILVERGELDAALRLVKPVEHPQALILAADVHARRGELDPAIGLAERALALDVDTPGALERRKRWSEQSDGYPIQHVGSDGPTVFGADPPVTSLRVISEAGRGGSGTVYQAQDEALGRNVALKLYHRPAQDRDKLEREAKLAVALSGPGIVRVLDVDLQRGWLLMEWASYGALRSSLAKKDLQRLSPLERWVLPMFRAVSRAHARGIVHADLKPSNVLFRTEDEPLLSDFGLARPRGEVALGGSLIYMSPERVGGAPLSFADDVFALGRIVEQALSAVSDSLAANNGSFDGWRELATAATSELDRRPADAAELIRVGSRLGIWAPPLDAELGVLHYA